MPSSRFLVRATNWVGDAVMTLPALRALRLAHPAATLDVLARPAVADVYKREGSVNEVIPLTAARGMAGIRAMPAAAAQLRARQYDCAVVLPNSFDSALLVWLARIPRRVGYSRDARRLLLTQPVRVPERGQIPEHERYYYLHLLAQGRLIPAAGEVAHVLLDDCEGARRTGLAAFHEEGLAPPVVGVSPGATNSRAKQWPPDRFIDAALTVARQLEARVAVFGTPAEADLCAEVAAGLSSRGCVVKSFAGRTSLGRFIDLAAGCSAFLTNDSGAMHIASALGVPTVAVFGPTNEFTTGPAGPRTTIVRKPVECMRCMYRDCPIDHRCMMGVFPDQVAQAVLDLLK